MSNLEINAELVLHQNTLYTFQSLGSFISEITLTGDPGLRVYLPKDIKDNNLFLLIDNELRSNFIFDNRSRDIYTIIFRIENAFNRFIDREFSINITKSIVPNLSTNDITLSTNEVMEKQVEGSVIGVLTALNLLGNVSKSKKFSLVENEQDNAYFRIDANFLSTNSVFNYDIKNEYSILVKHHDMNGNEYTKSFSIFIQKLNQKPTDIILSNATILNNVEIGSLIGTLSSIDPNENSTFTYSLPNIENYDNSLFQIISNELRTNTSFTSNPRRTFRILINSQDETGLSFSKNFIINVNQAFIPIYKIVVPNKRINEDSPINTFISYIHVFNSNNQIEDSVTISLPSNINDNNKFIITNDKELRVNHLFLQGGLNQTLTIRIDDGINTPLDENIIVQIVEINDGPTDILLSHNRVNMNAPYGTIVGTLTSIDEEDTPRFYTLDVNKLDNNYFKIEGNQLRTNTNAINTKVYYDIVIRVVEVIGKDTFGSYLDKNFQITTSEHNVAPDDIVLSNNTILELNPLSLTIGSLSATDPDGDYISNFSLALGGDNDFFEISIYNDLMFRSEYVSSLDFESKPEYNISIIATDSGGLSFQKNFTIYVIDVNEAPTDIVLSNNSINENMIVGSIIGTLSSVDPDIGDYGVTYELMPSVNESHQNDYLMFDIFEDTLISNAIFDYESKNLYILRIKVYDTDSNTFEKEFNIHILDVNEAPYDIQLSDNIIQENLDVNTVIGLLTASDYDQDSIFTFSLPSGINDNEFFNINGNELRSSIMFDYASKNIYNISIRVSDGTFTFEKQFFITIEENLLNLETATISLETFDNTENYSLSIYEETYDIELSFIDEAEVSMLTADGSSGASSIQLHAMGADFSDLNSECTWESSDIGIITVDNTGLCTCVGDGDAIITATLNGISRTCLITGFSTMPSVDDLYFLKGGKPSTTDFNFIFQNQEPLATFANANSAIFIGISNRTSGGIGPVTRVQFRGSTTRQFDLGMAGSGDLVMNTVEIAVNGDYIKTAVQSANVIPLGKFPFEVYTEGSGVFLNGSALSTIPFLPDQVLSNRPNLIVFDFTVARSEKLILMANAPSGTTRAQMLIPSNCLTSFCAQDYIRYTNILGRTNFTKIPNRGILGNTYDLTADNVPEGWFAGEELAYIDEAEVSMLTADGSSGASSIQLHAIGDSSLNLNNMCTWESSNDNIITVDNTGLCTCVGSGDAIITATRNGISRTCLITGFSTMPSRSNLYTLKGGSAPGVFDSTYINHFIQFTGSVPAYNANSSLVDIQFKTKTSGLTTWQSLEPFRFKNGTLNASYTPLINVNRPDRGYTYSIATRRWFPTNQFGHWLFSSPETINGGDRVYKIITNSNGTAYINDGVQTNVESGEGSTSSTGYLNITFQRGVRKLVLCCSDETIRTQAANFLSSSCGLFYIPQDYIRYADISGRTNFTKILNRGTLGNAHDLTANNVPAEWFNI